MGLIQKPKWAVALSSSLQSAFVCIDLSGPNLAANDISLCEHTKLQIFYPEGKLPRQSTNPGMQPGSVTVCITIVLARVFYLLLARLGLGLPGCLDSYFSQEVLHIAGIQISMHVQLSGLKILVYDCLDEVLVKPVT